MALGGTAFAEQVGRTADEVRMRLEGYALDIGLPQEGTEFILTDSPVQTLNHQSKTVGILAGVTFDQADSIIMPVGPKALIAPGPDQHFTQMPATAVDSVNSALLVSAQRFAYLRPRSINETWVRQAAVRLRSPSNSSR